MALARMLSTKARVRGARCLPPCPLYTARQGRRVRIKARAQARGRMRRSAARRRLCRRGRSRASPADMRGIRWLVSSPSHLNSIQGSRASPSEHLARRHHTRIAHLAAHARRAHRGKRRAAPAAGCQKRRRRRRRRLLHGACPHKARQGAAWPTASCHRPGAAGMSSGTRLESSASRRAAATPTSSCRPSVFFKSGKRIKSSISLLASASARHA